MCTWTEHFLTGSTLAVVSGKVALFHRHCSSSQLTGFFIVDWILHCANHRGFLGATVGTETFTDLDFADNVAVLAEMLDVLLLALGALKDEARPLGLEVN